MIENTLRAKYNESDGGFVLGIGDNTNDLVAAFLLNTKKRNYCII